jgi:hypothetical protein
MIVIGLILISLTLGIIFLAYWIPKKLGYAKAGKYIAIILTLSIIIIITLTIFEDDLFSKSDAQKLLAEQGIQLKDKFNIKENKSMFSPGDYYHTFILTISPSDKQKIINEIRNSANFTKANQSESYLENQEDYYNGSKRTKNYETDKQFIRELFEPHGKGYAPTWRKIEIDKKANKLIFEDIDE